MKLSLKQLNTKKRVLLGMSMLIVLLGAIYIFMRDEDVITKITEPDKKYYSQLTGVEVDKEISERPILGVMIENSEEARPQTGLDTAGIVFETVTEGGITRYLALYQENRTEEVGPVRSVRPAFVDWLMGFDASVAHVGGSELALDMITQQGAKSMNEFFNGDSYYRREDKEAPHDAYARVKDLVALQEKLGHKTSKMTEFPRTNDSPSAEPNAKIISIQFSHPIFSTQFTYNTVNNNYARNLAGTPHIDLGNNQQITVKNLIVLKMPSEEANAIGSGEALLYKDGTVQTIRWQQTDHKSRLKLLDATGNEVALNRGDSWFAAIPANGSVTAQ